MAEKTTPSRTVTRKPDDDLGKPGTDAVGGGRQTPAQAAITGTGEAGRSDTERKEAWRGSDGRPAAPPTGGASAGHADQTSAEDEHGRRAAGHYDVEKNRAGRRA